MSTRGRFFEELRRAIEAAGQIEDVKLFKAIDPLVRMFEMVAEEMMYSQQDLEEIMRQAGMQPPTQRKSPAKKPPADADAKNSVDTAEAKFGKNAYL